MPNDPKHEPNEPNLDGPADKDRDRKDGERQPARQPGGGQREGNAERTPDQPGGTGKAGPDKGRDGGQGG